MSAPPKNAGTLKSRPLAEILRWAQAESFTGALVLAHEAAKKSVLFEGGKIVQVRSNVAAESLVGLLLADKKIKPADLQAILPRLEGKESAQQAEELMKAGVITADAMLSAVQAQMEQRILEAFAWDDGKFALVPQAVDGVKIPLDATPTELVYRGLARRYAPETSPLGLTGDETTAFAAAKPFDERELRLPPKEAALLRAVGTEATILAASKAHGLTLRQAGAVFLALRDLGLVEIRAPKPKAAEAAPAVKPATVAEVQKRFKAFEGKDHFEVLEVADKASETQIKAAYFNLAKRFHPDRIAVATPVDKKIVEDHFALISRAHNVLSNPTSRKEYEASLHVESTGITAEQAEKILQSEMIFQKALLLLKKGMYKDTAQEIEQAVALYDQEPEYHMVLAWAQFRDAQQRKNLSLAKKFREAIEAAFQRNPRLAQAHYYLGMIDKAEGKLDSALHHFEKMLHAQPAHADAALEIRSIQMSRDKKEQKGLLGLFGKKK